MDVPDKIIMIARHNKYEIELLRDGYKDKETLILVEKSA